MAKAEKKATEKKAAAPAAPKKQLTKSEIFDAIATSTGKTKVEVKAFFDALTGVIAKQLSKKGPGAITIPGVAKLIAIKKDAVKGGKMVKNPFTGEMVASKPKPASFKLRARGLKPFIESLTK